jgi:ribosomal protein S18 acetylase RimI-like enzyme
MNVKAIDIARAAIHARSRHGSANIPQQRKLDLAADFGTVAVHPALRTRLAQRRELVLELAEIMQDHDLTAALLVARAAAA